MDRFVAVAQTGGAIALDFTLNATCDFGQGSSRSLPPCETHARGTIPAITFSNPQTVSGAFDGIQVLNGTYVASPDGRTFSTSGTALFAGLIKGCGVGTVYFDYAGEGTINTDGSNGFGSDTHTVVPGGTLAVAGSYEQRQGDGGMMNPYTRPETDVSNGDGTSNARSSGTISCDIQGLTGRPITTVIR